jgi:hypothetical protein
MASKYLFLMQSRPISRGDRAFGWTSSGGQLAEQSEQSLRERDALRARHALDVSTAREN